MSNLDKIYKLIKKKSSLWEDIEYIQFDIDMRDNDERQIELIPLERKMEKIDKKILKHMQSYIDNCNSK